LHRESETGDWEKVPLLGPKFLAMMDYMHVRALFNTKDTMHKVIKASDLNDALQKRIQEHGTFRNQFKKALESFYDGAGGEDGSSAGWDDRIPE
jgi:hypothetical protein